MKMEAMESDGSISRKSEMPFDLKPVAPEEGGEGLPYAPENWPEPGDTWKWKVGKRVTITGHYLDRYLYPPDRLRYFEDSTKKIPGFPSKLAVQRFISTKFPEKDVEEFFASFTWKVPSKNTIMIGKKRGHAYFSLPSEDAVEQALSELQSDITGCKAGNKMCKCNSPAVQAENSPLPMPCIICCTEPFFCRDCCCILCCKTINPDHGGFSYVKCEAIVSEDEGYVCGHVGHIDCALRTYLAGTVGGSIGLDAEYYCRRCDARADLVPHVTRMLQTCESMDSRDEVENILNVGFCVINGSQRPEAQGLLNRIEFALRKLKCGTMLKDIWKVEDIKDVTVVSDAPEGSNPEDLLDNRTSSPEAISISSNWQAECVKLDYEIDQVLQRLRMAKESEYAIAEEQLYTQREYIKNLFLELDKERTELARRTSTADTDTLLSAVLNRVDQIKQGMRKLKDMGRVANGFGRAPKHILKEHFGLEIE